jgi:AcrR family transcriptional regulator
VNPVQTHQVRRDEPVTGRVVEGRLREIVDHAASLFDEFGYGNVSMEDIATAVGVRKSTLYHYVRSRDEILFLIHQEFMDYVLAKHRERIGDGLSAQGLLSAFMADIVGLMEEHRGHVRVFFEHYRELPDDLQVVIENKRTEYELAVRAAVALGVKNGEFRPVPEWLTTLALFGMCNWAYQWYRPGGPLSATDIAGAFADLLLVGLLSDAARSE